MRWVIALLFTGCSAPLQMLPDNFPLFLGYGVETRGRSNFVFERYDLDRNGEEDMRVIWLVRGVEVDSVVRASKVKPIEQWQYHPYQVEYFRMGFILVKRLTDDELDNTPNKIEELIDGEWQTTFIREKE